MHLSRKILAVSLTVALYVLSSSVAADAVAAEDEKHLLRYQFTPGETLRTKVVHQATVRTTVEGTSQTASTVSKSTKVWFVNEVDDEGHITFVHSVEHVDMKNEVTGREGIVYDSRSDEKPPQGFEHVAKRIGVPLTKIKMTATGEILERKELAPEDASQPSQIVLPLPKEAVAVGETWSEPHEFILSLDDGTTKRIKSRQRFELKNVEHGVATIHIATQTLTPVSSPEVRAQLVQRESEGTIRFDVDAGRILGQKIDLDRRVVGHPNPKSSMHYRIRFTEELLDDDDAAAEEEVAAADKETDAEKPEAKTAENTTEEQTK